MFQIVEKNLNIEDYVLLRVEFLKNKLMVWVEGFISKGFEQEIWKWNNQEKRTERKIKNFSLIHHDVLIYTVNSPGGT